MNFADGRFQLLVDFARLIYGKGLVLPTAPSSMAQ